MAYDPDTLLAAYTHTPGETLEEADHAEGLHELDRQELRGIKAALGLTPAASDTMTMVRIGDGVGGTTGKGIWVPLAALGPSIITNSNYDHWQRGTGARTHTTTYNNDTSYSADRMFTRPSGASVTSQRSTTVPNAQAQYSCQINGAASVTTVDHGQRLTASAVNTRCLRSLVFSAWVRNESGASFTPNLRVGTPASADDFTTVTNRLDQALQSCADSAWTRVYHVFDPSAYTNIANGMEVCLRVPSGSLVSGDVVRVAQFDLRPGTQLMAYVPPDPEQELWRCLHHYRHHESTAANQVFAFGTANTTSIVRAPYPLMPRMRVAPTLSVVNLANIQAVADDSSAIALTSLSALTINPEVAWLAANSSAGYTRYRPYSIDSNASGAALKFVAEL